MGGKRLWGSTLSTLCFLRRKKEKRLCEERERISLETLSKRKGDSLSQKEGRGVLLFSELSGEGSPREEGCSSFSNLSSKKKDSLERGVTIFPLST